MGDPDVDGRTLLHGVSAFDITSYLSNHDLRTGPHFGFVCRKHDKIRQGWLRQCRDTAEELLFCNSRGTTDTYRLAPTYYSGAALPSNLFISPVQPLAWSLNVMEKQQVTTRKWRRTGLCRDILQGRSQRTMPIPLDARPPACLPRLSLCTNTTMNAQCTVPYITSHSY